MLPSCCPTARSIQTPSFTALPPPASHTISSGSLRPHGATVSLRHRQLPHASLPPWKWCADPGKAPSPVHLIYASPQHPLAEKLLLPSSPHQGQEDAFFLFRHYAPKAQLHVDRAMLLNVKPHLLPGEDAGHIRAGMADIIVDSRLQRKKRLAMPPVPLGSKRKVFAIHFLRPISRSFLPAYAPFVFLILSFTFVQ